MKKLDIYIIKKYLGTFFFTALIFSLITIIVDFSEKVDEFIEESVTIKEIVFDHYFNYIPHINLLLWPLFALIAVIFFTSRLAYNSEIISIFNAGVSYKRFMMPFLAGAGIISVIHLAGSHIYIPKGNKVRVAFYNKYISSNSDKGKKTNIHFFIDDASKVYINNYRKRDSTAFGFRIERYNGQHLDYILKAKRLEWKGLPSEWRIKDYEIRTFRGMEETYISGKNKHIDTTLNVLPKDFEMYKNEKEKMTTAEIKAHIANERRKGKGNTKIFEVEIFRRTADTFSLIILTILGMSVASRKVRGGMGLHLAIGAGLGAMFILLSKFSITFATNHNLPPMAAVWLPNIIFLFVGLFLVNRAQK